MTRNHIIDGEFQSDKYPTTPRGKVPLSVKDKMAQDLLWAYARRHRMLDAEFSDDLEFALKKAGYIGAMPQTAALERLMDLITDLPGGALGYVAQTTPPYKLDVITIALHGLRGTIETMKAALHVAELRQKAENEQ